MRGPASIAVVATMVLALVVSSCGGEQASAPASSGSSGATIARARGCVACHSVDGAASVGPTWKGLAGSDVPLADGSVVRADTAYLRQSIVAPDAARVRGFSVTMPRLALTEDDVAALVAYIESLR